MSTEHYSEIRRLILDSINRAGEGNLVTTGHLLLAMLCASNSYSSTPMLVALLLPEHNTQDLKERVQIALEEASRERNLQEVAGESILFSASYETALELATHFATRGPANRESVNTAFLVYGLYAEHISIASRVMREIGITHCQIEVYLKQHYAPK